MEVSCRADLRLSTGHPRGAEEEEAAEDEEEAEAEEEEEGPRPASAPMRRFTALGRPRMIP